MIEIKENVLGLVRFDFEDVKHLSQKNKPNELLGNLNPRYFEEVITLKDAKNMIFSQLGNNGTLFNISSVY